MKCMCEIFLTFIGRCCLALIFVLSAVGDLKNPAAAEAGMKKVMQAPGSSIQVPDAAIPVLRWVAIVFRFVGSALLVLGFWARLGALLLILFLIPATYLFHMLTMGSDPTQFIEFLKNLAIFGGLLIVLARGPGMCSLDYWRAAKKEPAKAPAG